MRNRTISWAFVGTIVAVVLSQSLAGWGSGRAGQVIFRPVPVIVGGSSEYAGDLPGATFSTIFWMILRAFNTMPFLLLSTLPLTTYYKKGDQMGRVYPR